MKSQYTLEQYEKIDKFKKELLSKIPEEAVTIQDKVKNIFETLFKYEKVLNDTTFMASELFEQMDNPFKKLSENTIDLDFFVKKKSMNIEIKGFCLDVGDYEIKGFIKNKMAYFTYNSKNFENKKETFTLKIGTNKSNGQLYTIYDEEKSFVDKRNHVDSVLEDKIMESKLIQKYVFNNNGHLLQIYTKIPQIDSNHDSISNNSKLGTIITIETMMPENFILKKTKGINSSSTNVIYSLQKTLNPLKTGTIMFNSLTREYNELLCCYDLEEYIKNYMIDKIQNYGFNEVHSWRSRHLEEYLYVLLPSITFATKLDENEYKECLENHTNVNEILKNRIFLSNISYKECFKYVNGNMVPQNEEVEVLQLSKKSLEAIKSYKMN